MQMTNEDKFYEWWNGDEMADDLDVVKHTPLYWAMQGWEAALRNKLLKKKEWVGLTDEEIAEIYRAGWSNGADFARTLEARLKDKNSTTEKNIQTSDNND